MFINRLKTSILAVVVILFALSLVLYPAEVMRSSLHGLHIWWNVVLPTMLPFFITAELMMRTGVVNWLGIILEPLMRPILRIPGIGGFVLAVGLISGNPMGAKLTAELRAENLITRIEAERLVSCASMASPLFIFGAIAVGFFENASVGSCLAIAHYIGILIVGIVMRFYGYQQPLTPKRAGQKRFETSNTFKNLERRPLGELLGHAVSSSMQIMLMIGGFIILFSVLTNIIIYTNIAGVISLLFGQVLKSLSFPGALQDALLVGIFEMTLGSQLASAGSIDLIYQLSIVSFIIGFGGFSIHAQVASILSKTDVRYRPYFFARLLHATVAACITFGSHKLLPGMTPNNIQTWNGFNYTQLPIIFYELKWLSSFIFLFWILLTIKKIYNSRTIL